MRLIINHSQQRANLCKMGDSEHDHCKKIVENICKILKEEGKISYKYCGDSPQNMTDKESLYWAVDQSNKIYNSKEDIHLSIHTNAGGGSGCESIYYPGNIKGKNLGIRICRRLEKLGLKYRRTFGNKNLVEMNKTKATAVLVECWFHDSNSEATWGHRNIDTVALAIVQGIYDFMGLGTVESTASTENQKIVQKIIELLNKIK